MSPGLGELTRLVDCGLELEVCSMSLAYALIQGRADIKNRAIIIVLFLIVIIFNASAEL